MNMIFNNSVSSLIVGTTKVRLEPLGGLDYT